LALQAARSRRYGLHGVPHLLARRVAPQAPLNEPLGAAATAGRPGSEAGTATAAGTVVGASSPAGSPPGTVAGELVGERGERLVWEHWPGATGARPVAFLHGFGDHVGWWRHVAAALSGSGYPVWLLDLAGHGRSGGPRADVGQLGWALQDVDRFLAAVESGAGAPGGGSRPQGTAHLAGPLKPVLFGDSMGGAIAAAYAASRPGRLGALVLSAPALHLVSYPRWQSAAVRALAVVAPRVGLARLDPSHSTHDLAWVEASEKDPLGWHGKVTARSALTIFDAGRKALEGAPSMTLPVLILHGEEDRVVPVGSSRRFFELLGSADKELVTFPGFYHEVFKELGRQQVIDVLLNWLGRH
jgi:acylglycerol lipase